MISTAAIEAKIRWIKRETLSLHRLAPDTRIASSLSCVEIFAVLYYAGILRYDPGHALAETRDRFIVSKAHGAISLYPVLADLNFFDREELKHIGETGALLGVIPDGAIPGFEAMNGSLGHGLGVACGIAVALKRKSRRAKVFVLAGDGELNEGSTWEGILFAAHHKLDNLVLIVDDNGRSMLGPQEDIMDLQPLEEKFRVLRWLSRSVDGHDIGRLYSALRDLKRSRVRRPRVLVAKTRKGHGVASLESDPLCHVRSLAPDTIDQLLRAWQ